MLTCNIVESARCYGLKVILWWKQTKRSFNKFEISYCVHSLFVTKMYTWEFLS